jgi:two-component system chemotaxis response regulator CheB
VSTIRVLVIHRSVTMRRMLTEVLDSTPGIEMAGSVPDGRVGVAQISLVKPDVVLLEAGAARTDVLDALAAIRRVAAGLPVVMFSPATGPGAAVTLEALNRGADGYVAQPGAHAPGGPIRYLLDEVCPALRRLGAACGAGADRRLDRMVEGLRVHGVDATGDAPTDTPVGSRNPSASSTRS